MSAQPGASPAAPSTSRRRWAILLVLAGSQMLVQLDATIINTALPAIKRAFEMSESQSLWVADAYMVIFGGLLLLAGALGDRFGRRKMLIVGMTIFVAASIAVAFSPDANFMIIGRGLQGSRRRACHPPDALHPHCRLPPRRARSRDRHLGRRDGLRHGLRTARRRNPRRRHRLGRRLLGARADRPCLHGRHGRRPRVPLPAAHQTRRARRDHRHHRHDRDRLRHHRGHPKGLDRPADRRLLRRRRDLDTALHHRRAAH